MPLTLENAGALVPGGVPPRAIEEEKKMQAQQTQAQPKTLRVKVLRPFYYQGKPVEKDAIVELPRVFAMEMRDARKALVVEVADAQAEPEAPAATKKPAAAGKETK